MYVMLAVDAVTTKESSQYAVALAPGLAADLVDQEMNINRILTEQWSSSYRWESGW